MAFTMVDIKNLQKHWYDKLKAEGFKDIENSDGTLKAEIHSLSLGRVMLEKSSREAYYSIARAFLLSHKFATLKDKAVWQAHCDGASYRTISEITGLSVNRIFRLMRSLKKVAKLK